MVKLRQLRTETEMPTASNRIPWPPIIYVCAVAVGLALNSYVAFASASGVLQTTLIVLGACSICAGLVLEIVTALTFRKHATTILPHRAASALITTGPFAKTRNPIYLGNTLLVIGVGLVFGNFWLIPCGFAAALFVQKLAIEREEKHLESVFGDHWRNYAAQTPRWLLF